METKYTKDGKKVVVLGKLNNTQWIVQEVFIVNGQEIPSGESFVETTLLDKPAKTWRENEAAKLEARMVSLRKEIDWLSAERKILTRVKDVASLINKATEKYRNVDIYQLDRLLAFMSGEITHVVYDLEIKELGDALEMAASNRTPRFEGLKLVSLFGCKRTDESFGLDYRINEYYDGSGCWTTFYPCKSYEEAVEKLDDLIADKKATEELINLKERYGLVNPTEEKIQAYYKKQKIYQKQRIIEAWSKVEKMELELKEIGN